MHHGIAGSTEQPARPLPPAAVEFATNHPLIAPLTLGALHLRHRIVLAGAPGPSGGIAEGPPDPSLMSCYAARATPGGLLICAAAPTARASAADAGTVPGIHSAAQTNAWRDVTEAMHARGALAIAQLGDAATDARALPDLDGIEAALEAYRSAAENAADARFDGVELLCTSGTLADRFLRRSHTSAAWGSDTTRDQDFALDALQAIVSSWPPSRVGVCLSLPQDAAGLQVARALLASAQGLGLAYAHMVSWSASLSAGTSSTLGAVVLPLRPVLPGKLIVAGDWTVEAAARAIEVRAVDAVSVDMASANEAGVLRLLSQLREQG